MKKGRHALFSVCGITRLFFADSNDDRGAVCMQRSVFNGDRTVGQQIRIASVTKRNGGVRTAETPLPSHKIHSIGNAPGSGAFLSFKESGGPHVESAIGRRALHNQKLSAQ